MIHLLTGAAGFIGSHVAERLLARGDQVVGVDNFDPFYARTVKNRNLARLIRHPNFRLVELDIREADAVAQLIRDCAPGSVLHLAAKAGVRPSIADPAAYLETNIGGTLNLLRACEGSVVEQFVFASSSSVYGNSVSPPFREDDRTDFPESPYGASKKSAEVLCFTYHQLLQVPIACLRFFTVYGPRQRPDLAIHKFTRLIDQGTAIPFYGDGTTSRDYTFVEDTVDGILAALDRPDGFAVYNLGRSDPINLSQLVESIECALGKKAVLDHRPEQPGDVRMTCADVTRASEKLGYRPQVELREGIERFVRWFRETQD